MLNVNGGRSILVICSAVRFRAVTSMRMCARDVLLVIRKVVCAVGGKHAKRNFHSLALVGAASFSRSCTQGALNV